MTVPSGEHHLSNHYSINDSLSLCRLWSVSLRRLVRKAVTDSSARCISWSPDGKLIVVGLGGASDGSRQRKDGAYLILDGETLQPIFEGRLGEISLYVSFLCNKSFFSYLGILDIGFVMPNLVRTGRHSRLRRWTIRYTSTISTTTVLEGPVTSITHSSCTSTSVPMGCSFNRTRATMSICILKLRMARTIRWHPIWYNSLYFLTSMISVSFTLT